MDYFQAKDCIFVVDYYGLNFIEGDVHVYMELMVRNLATLHATLQPHALLCSPTPHLVTLRAYEKHGTTSNRP